MLLHLRRAVVLSLIFLAVLGLAYPLAGTSISLLFFRYQAEGSLVTDGPQVVGSTIIGQQWPGPKWFQGRPDGYVLTNKPDQVVVSGTEQLGPRSKALKYFVAQQAARLKREGIEDPTVDLVTNSGSLVDPDISLADANVQVPAVAKANHLPEAVLYKLARSQLHGRQLGFLGAPYIDVLDLNLALAKLTHP
jgi:K+-transporting ATPase ATPase C chain